MYKNGEGVKQDYQTAMGYFYYSASQGNSNAQNCIGMHLI